MAIVACKLVMCNQEASAVWEATTPYVKLTYSCVDDEKPTSAQLLNRAEGKITKIIASSA